MFERFTDRARQIVVLSQEEARLYDVDVIDTEFLVLGILQEGNGIAAHILHGKNITLDSLREEVKQRSKWVNAGEGKTRGHLPFTPQAKKCLELALREALQLGHNYIGTEHLLLGVLRQEEGLGAQILNEKGIDLSSARQQVIELLTNYLPTQQKNPADPHIAKEAEKIAQALTEEGPLQFAKESFALWWDDAGTTHVNRRNVDREKLLGALTVQCDLLRKQLAEEQDT